MARAQPLARVALRALQAAAAFAANATSRHRREYNSFQAGDQLTAHRIARLLTGADSLLDIGCGSGDLLRLIRSESSIRVRGVDLGPPGDRGGIRIDSYDGTYLEYPDASFDVCVLAYVLHHLEPDHAQQLLQEAIRLARKRILIIEDSLDRFSWAYRVRNRVHRVESHLQTTWSSGARAPARGEAMFLTWHQWRDLLGTLPRVARVRVESLARFYPYAHHTLLDVELEPVVGG